MLNIDFFFSITFDCLKLGNLGVTSQEGLVGDQKHTRNSLKVYHSSSFGNVSM